MAKNKMPPLLYVIRDEDDVLLADDDFSGMEDGDDVAIYELIKVAKVARPSTLTDIKDVPRELRDVTMPDRKKR